MAKIKSTLLRIRNFDEATYQHCLRTDAHVKKLMQLFGIKDENLHIAALLHDIGKIYIDIDILNKPGKLTPEERNIVDMHSYYGYLYLKEQGFNEEICSYVLFHHGCKSQWKEKIADIKKPVMVCEQILKACDIYDAMTSKRPYRNAATVSESLEVLKKEDIPDDIISCISHI